MTNELTTDREVENIANAAREDAGFQKMLKFKKGDYWLDNEEVPLGSVYLAHAKAWAKTWIHFENKLVVERRVYKVALGDRVPERDQIPNNDQSTWPKDPNGKPIDPWALQYLVPFENMENGDVQIFVAQSFGGRRAIGALCTAWAKRVMKNPKSGQPIIKLDVTSFPTKNWGDVKAPLFEIIGWDDTVAGQVVKQIDMEKVKPADQFDDEIPF
jgi:hypothetical protein